MTTAELATETRPNIRQIMEEHTVFFRVGDDIVDAGAYRSRWMQQWQMALKGSPAGEDMLTEALGQSATAYACIEKRSTTLSGLPIRVGNRAGEMVEWHPLHHFLEDTTMLLHLTEYALNVYGVSYLQKLRNPSGFPTRLQWLHPSYVEFEPQQNVYTVRDENGQMQYILPRNMIRVEPPKLTHKQSALDVAISRVGAEGGIMRFSASYFMNSAKPEGILVYTGKGKLDDVEKEKAQKEWKQFQNPENAHKTFVSSGEWNWIPITPNPVDLAMVELSNEIAEDICKIFSVNPVLIGAATASDPLSAQNTYKGIERDFVENVIIPRLEYIFSELNRQWLWRDFRDKNLYTLIVDRRSIGILSDITGDNVTTASSLTTSGVGDYPEARAIMGLDPRENYFLRDPEKALSTLAAGMVTLNESRELVGLEPFNGINGRVVQVSPGMWIPESRLYEYAEANFDQLINPPDPAPAFGQTMMHQPAEIRSLIQDTLQGEMASFVLRLAETILTRQPAPIQPAAPALPEPAPPVKRNHSRIDLVVDLTENAFVRGMVRILAESLTSHNVSVASWFDETRWHVPLVSLPDGTINDAGVLIKSVGLTEQIKLDAVIKGSYVKDGTLYLGIEQTSELSQLRSSVVSELTAQGYAVSDVNNWQPGIPVAYITETPPHEALALDAAFPIVLNNVTLLLDQEDLHTWSFRTFTVGQQKELVNWRHKARNRGIFVRFTPDKLQDTIIPDFIRWMRVLGHDTETIFERAFRVLEGESGDKSLPIRANISEIAPEDFEAYWEAFDSIAGEIGQDWLNGYMGRSWDALKPEIRPELRDVEIEQALRSNRDELLNDWVGTKDQPGSVTRLLMAGMAAGHELLVEEIPDTIRSVIRAVDVAIDWDVLNEDAIQFARSYTYNLIRGLDNTTMKQVQRAVSKWLEDVKTSASGESTGDPLTIDDLAESIEGIFNNPVRAEMIAETEATRIYNRGSEQRWKKVGVQRAKWVTSRDSRVCEICAPLHGTISEIGAGHEHPGGFYREEGLPQLDARSHAGKRYDTPAHVRCRCGKRPVVDFSTPTLNDTADPGEMPDAREQLQDQARRDLAARRQKAQNMDVRSAMKEFRRELDQINMQIAAMPQRTADMTRQIDEAKQEVDGHVSRWRTLTDEINRHYRDLQSRTDLSDEEFARLREERIKPLQDERDVVGEKWSSATGRATELAMRRAKVHHEFGIRLGADTPEMELKARARVRKFPEVKERTDEAADWLRKTFNGDTYRFPDEINVRRKQRRASFDPATGDVNVADTDDVSVYIHEMGHSIEDADPAIHARCVEFLEARTANEQEQRMRSLFPGYGYGSHEVTKADAFPSPYVGKQYKKRNGKYYATEVLSMGLQYLYDDPVAFHRSDPEYFEFVISIVRGYIA